MARRKPIIREKNIEEISRRYLRGETQSAIGLALGLTQQTVSNDLKLLQKRWQKSALIDIDQKKGEELAKIDHLEREYWQAWERSQQPAQVQSSKMVSAGLPGASRDEASLRTEQQVGDARYLEGVRWCITERIRILGLAAATKTDITSGGKALERMTDAELIEFITARITRTGEGG